jgi:hypothetical protein
MWIEQQTQQNILHPNITMQTKITNMMIKTKTWTPTNHFGPKHNDANLNNEHDDGNQST